MLVIHFENANSAVFLSPQTGSYEANYKGFKECLNDMVSRSGDQLCLLIDLQINGAYSSIFLGLTILLLNDYYSKKIIYVTSISLFL